MPHVTRRSRGAYYEEGQQHTLCGSLAVCEVPHAPLSFHNY